VVVEGLKIGRKLLFVEVMTTGEDLMVRTRKPFTRAMGRRRSRKGW
jgi:hypothetical protein